MPNLLEITGDDVASLDDADLRTLIGLLCEADYRLAGLPIKGITWGGHQDARDGGLDVVVRGEMAPPLNSFVPRSITGFQVKKPDMPRNEILKEMRPNGALREEIKSLIQEKGAYIIVSSSGSTTDPALRNRIAAMKEAVAAEINHHDLHLDFLDRGRVATWLRLHPSLILWVRNKIGRQLRGWQPYANWAKAPGGIEEEYLNDDGLRLQDGIHTAEEGISVEDGIGRLRASLSTTGKSVRLAGLSGVGKTRLVQALFDERIGEQALNRTLAYYTDISDSPDPDPKTFAEQLVSLRTRAILIIDNCPPELHRNLTSICSVPGSFVSLLSVEYDVREDLPEETCVYRLEPASDELIEKLIMLRFSHISQVDAGTIAEFSGGNARLAIALATTVQLGETLSGFKDEELFKRLFHQRHDTNENLLVAAEACSLVYSFEGTDVTSEKSELNLLASLVAMTGSDLYRDVYTLRERDLVQARDRWRAVLPHAIANRLAKRAFASIPKDTIVNAFLCSGAERIIKSFSRRLNYLHDCDITVEIVGEWLAPDGWIGKAICNFNEFGMEVFRNIAPVAPEKTLEAIELAANGDEGRKFTSRENKHFHDFVRILRHLAYDPMLFDRSVNIICRFALAESAEERNNSTRDVLKSLFYIHLSGTHASIETRAKFIEELIDAVEQDKQDLGLLLLDAALTTEYFSSSHDFSFGARKRDFGYEPGTYRELRHWFKVFIGICTSVALSGKPIAQQARITLSSRLRGLWTRAGMLDLLENSAKQIQKQRAWNDGWIAVRGIIHYDGKGFTEDILERLHRLEDLLKPADLLERARTYALSDRHRSFDLEDDFGEEENASTSWRRAEEITRRIGAQVAQDMDVLDALLPDIVTSENTRLISFGRGLADGGRNKQEIWQILHDQLGRTPADKRQLGVFIGFLSACSEIDPEFYHATLDNLINDELLGEWLPIFQTTSTIDKRGIIRLHEALDTGKADIRHFQHLAYGRAHESISDDDLASLLRKILTKKDGIHVAIEILQMRFYSPDNELPEFTKNLLEVARYVLSIYSFPGTRSQFTNQDYGLAHIAHICLVGYEGIDAAKETCQQMVAAITDNRIHFINYPDLSNALAKTQPMVFLDAFFGNDAIEEYQLKSFFHDHFERRNNPLDEISDGDIVSWCEINPIVRYPGIASAIHVFWESEDRQEIAWKPIFYAIVKNAPDLEVVLGRIANSIRPMSWSGSRADIMQKRSVLFQSFYDHENPRVSEWAKKRYADLQEAIKREREWEASNYRDRNESFE